MSATSQVAAPIIEPGVKVKGPASYFASIEATYGRPMQEWLDLLTSQWAGSSHMEIVTTLKNEHGMGHGHANAIVAYVKAALANAPVA
jgi:hypothetical protein